MSTKPEPENPDSGTPKTLSVDDDDIVVIEDQNTPKYREAALRYH